MNVVFAKIPLKIQLVRKAVLGSIDKNSDDITHLYSQWSSSSISLAGSL
jgi:hypothetical protein